MPALTELVLPVSRILPHLPRNIYPALPATVHLDARSEYQGDKTEENEDDAWDQSMHVDDTGTPAANPSNAADIFRSEARHLQGHVQQAQQRRHGVGDRTQIDDDGGVRLLCGPIAGLDGSELPQTPIEIERFTGIRLGTSSR